MAGAKELKKRISSVNNTKKITKTMEMVSTSKSKKMVKRVNAAKPYGEKLLEIMETLGKDADSVESPYLRKEDKPKKAILLVVTADRGLCSGYNTNVLRMARHRMKVLEDQGVHTELHVIGKKGHSFFRFMKIDLAKSIRSKEDKLEYDDARELAEEYMSRFSSREVDLVEVVSTVYITAVTQKPAISTILPAGLQESAPVGAEEKKKDHKKPVPAGVIFEPAPEVILSNLIPHLIKSNLYRILLEAGAAEQIYRRIAMKSATDAATDMSKLLTRTYNRIRQASITQELSEIVAGADSVS
jgi:F-type H+-transporting ATPase subunit gamma